MRGGREINDMYASLLFIDLHRIIVPKRRRSYEELKHQNPKRPPVHGSSVPWFEDIVKNCSPRCRIGLE